MTSLCGLLGKSKQAYYKHEDTAIRKIARESFCVEFIKEIRARAPGIGGTKLWQMYSRRFGAEHSVGYNRFYDIIDKYNLKVRKRRRRLQTTNSAHAYPTYPNLTRMLIPTGVNQLWVSDITYIPFWQNRKAEVHNFCYLSLITDYYSKQIIGYCVGESLQTRYCIKALEMALQHADRLKVPIDSLIHHSDRGVQYAGYEYTGLLNKRHIRISMTQSGDPKENAVAERVNNTIKNEFLKGMEFSSIGQVRSAIKVAVEFYNNERPHMSLDGMTPAEASLLRGEIKKRWVSYREKAIKEVVA